MGLRVRVRVSPALQQQCQGSADEERAVLSAGGRTSAGQYLLVVLLRVDKGRQRHVEGDSGRLAARYLHRRQEGIN